MSAASRDLCLSLAAMLSVMAAGACAAADAPAAPVAPAAIESQLPVQQAPNIDEIWVRGKRLTEVIVDAEDEFFKLYNKANKNSDYDIHCGTTSLSSGSMIMIRKCVPGFIVNNYYNVMTNTVSLGTSSFGSCSSGTPVTGNYGEISYYEGYCSTPVFITYPVYVPPPPGLLIMERGPAYVNNVVGVVSRDPLMVKMANHLVDLYNELESLQHRFVDARKAGQKVRSSLRGAKAAGPRAL